MPEYLAPGVYVEEVSFRAKSIEGVSTTTTGFIGPTRYGPTDGELELITSFNDFERVYGGLDPLEVLAVDDSGYDPATPPVEIANYMAHAVRAFFDNGGQRLYVARTFRSIEAASAARIAGGDPPIDAPTGLAANGVARAAIPLPSNALAPAQTAAANAVTSAIAALSAARSAANAARAAAIDSLTNAIRTVQEAFPAAAPPIAVDVTTDTSAVALNTIDTAIGALQAADQPNAQTARTNATTAITNAADARIAATTALTNAAAEQTNVTAAIAAGTTAGDAAPLPLPALATAEAAAVTATTSVIAAGGSADASVTAANSARDTVAASQAALSALASNTAAAARLAAATTTADDATAAATAAGAAVTAASSAAPLILTAAQDGRILARVTSSDAEAVGTFVARFPGAAGNVSITLRTRLGQNGLPKPGSGNRLSQVQHHDIVLISRPAGDALFLAELDGGGWSFRDNANVIAIGALDPNTDRVRRVLFNVEIDAPGAFAQPQVWADLSLDPDRAQSIPAVFAEVITNRSRELQTPVVIGVPTDIVALARSLIGAVGLAALPASGPNGIQTTYQLTGGNDGGRPSAEDYVGQGGDPSVPNSIKSGLVSFEDIDEISIVAAPGLSFGATNGYAATAAQATQSLISHVERMRYRVLVLDSPNAEALSQVRDYRAVLDTRRAALYYPWVSILDPVSRETIDVPPSGFVTGIYARSDNERGVSKAPANEVVTGAIGLETLINKAQQEILNPDGINCLRLFENRGFRVWGARTLSSDPEWKYVNVIRYFAYLEHSIDRGTQWAVFESNGDALWANVRRTIEDFLFSEWRTGALLGRKPEDAFFVRVDRSTMSQNDLDNGRLICLIGVAVVKPAEFVIFRIGQMTADSPA